MISVKMAASSLYVESRIYHDMITEHEVGTYKRVGRPQERGFLNLSEIGAVEVSKSSTEV